MLRRLMECLEGLRAQADSPGPTQPPPVCRGGLASPGPVSHAARSPVELRVERRIEEVGQQSGRVLAAIDKKIIPKPSTYSGAVREYVGWNDGFKDLLETQDERWRPLLEEIEKTGADAMNEERMMQIENIASLDIKGQVKEFSKQLYT